MTLATLTVDTWAALLRPRRLLALVAVGVPLAYGQSVWTDDVGRGVFSALAPLLATVLIGPVAWRWLDPTRGPVPAASFLAIALATTTASVVWVPRALGLEDPFLASPPALAFVVGLFVAGASGLGFDVATERRAEELARDRDRAELLALRAQLDPHFLFNTLNAIAEWCARDPAVAEDSVLRLSSALRRVQSAVRLDRWPLEDELDLCRDVLALHHVRDPGRFVGDVAGGAPGVTVPPMVLLPLVENAVKHGPAAGHEGAVAVSVAEEGGGARIVVENPGAFGGRREGGEGLVLLERRLALAYGAAARFAIGSGGRGTVATLVVPRAPMGSA